jgi:hypothetical protein
MEELKDRNSYVKATNADGVAILEATTVCHVSSLLGGLTLTICRHGALNAKQSNHSSTR